MDSGWYKGKSRQQKVEVEKQKIWSGEAVEGRRYRVDSSRWNLVYVEWKVEDRWKKV